MENLCIYKDLEYGISFAWMTQFAKKFFKHKVTDDCKRILKTT